ncbi:MAG: ATP-binding cassette domain-containing protein [[Clostridium] fimetarium]|nr:ATP-binding cassette domain-containing protein [Alistipes timonensis]MCM1404851.1 ATP-binding cassette domain-containing protein [[Clostridium] fimetarium]
MTIESISLVNLLPEAFSGQRERHETSDVWLKENVVFSKGSTYLAASASGGGKSSLCSYIYGRRSDYEGRVLFNGTDIRTLKGSDWDAVRRYSLAWLPQELGLFPTLTAIENIMLKAVQTGYRSERQAREMLERLGLGSQADRPVRLMSLGQCQRVAAVRALCQPFDFLLLDEPVSHLDAESNAALSALIADEVRINGAGVIVTSVGNTPSIDIDFTLNL